MPDTITVLLPLRLHADIWAVGESAKFVRHGLVLLLVFFVQLLQLDEGHLRLELILHAHGLQLSRFDLRYLQLLLLRRLFRLRFVTTRLVSRRQLSRIALRRDLF